MPRRGLLFAGLVLPLICGNAGAAILVHATGPDAGAVHLTLRRSGDDLTLVDPITCATVASAPLALITGVAITGGPATSTTR